MQIGKTQTLRKVLPLLGSLKTSNIQFNANNQLEHAFGYTKNKNIFELAQNRQTVADEPLTQSEKEKTLEVTAQIFLKQNKVQEAKNSAKECIRDFSSNKNCLIVLANAELQAGTKEEQVVAVESCLKIYPNEPQCKNIMGNVQMNQGHFDDAATIFANLIRSNGDYGVRFNDSHLYWQVAYAQEMAGHLDEAYENYMAACKEQNPEACEKAEELSKLL